MTKSTQPCSEQGLLEKANFLLKAHPDYLPGIAAEQIEQRGDVLVFKGNFYLDDQGLPTPKTTVVFNLFKYLAHTLSSLYHLEESHKK